MSDGTRALLAAIPIVLVLGLIASRRASSPHASLAGAAVAFALSVGAFGLPVDTAAAAVAFGMATGLHPIVYIIFGSLLLHHLTIVTGWAERLRKGLAGLVRDRFVLLLLVGFGFAAFIDSTAGFLAPVTISVALLVGLGVPRVEAAAYTLVASSMPPVIGGMGIPVFVLSEAARIQPGALARTAAPVAGLLLAFFPATLTLTFGGLAELRRTWAPSLAAGLAYGGVFAFTVRYLSFNPASLLASVSSMAAVLVTAPFARGAVAPGGKLAAARPCWPYAILMATVVAWAVPSVSRALATLTVRVPFPGLPGAVWKLDVLASPGTAILLAAVLVALAARATLAQARAALRASLTQLRHPLVTLLAMFALAQLMAASGMTRSVGVALAGSGRAFPALLPWLAWLGAGIAGSNTASHALLGGLQAETAARLGLDPVRVAAIALIAAPFGKMIAPQVIAAAVAAADAPGAEPRLLRTGLLHSAFWTALVAAFALAWVR